MSRADTPTLPHVLPTYRKLTKDLTALKSKPNLQSYSTALEAGILKLDKYNRLAQANQFYVVATVCHPTYRLGWFGKRTSPEFQRAKVPAVACRSGHLSGFSEPVFDSTHVVVSDIPLPSFNGVEAQIHQFVLEAVFKATLANKYIFIYRFSKYIFIPRDMRHLRVGRLQKAYRLDLSYCR
ncbi:hypothetical protein D9758_009003 [Tetrapyrgos nigripes]|uniref:Uncharacterized protein n=1 Tax=Tetrapyrgos nigripes TaxID=182062 RepID=A0A8H5GKY0_9AGAR|nr:hypothetical protein D9758_009003 [Tetrapyrgos nigripes]